MSKLEDSKLENVVGGAAVRPTLGSIDYDDEVQQILLSNKNADNNFRKDYADHYIILTEVKKKFAPDQYGWPTILTGMSIRYSVYATDGTKIKDGYIADFIM